MQNFTKWSRDVRQDAQVSNSKLTQILPINNSQIALQAAQKRLAEASTQNAMLKKTIEVSKLGLSSSLNSNSSSNSNPNFIRPQSQRSVVSNITDNSYQDEFPVIESKALDTSRLKKAMMNVKNINTFSPMKKTITDKNQMPPLTNNKSIIITKNINNQEDNKEILRVFLKQVSSMIAENDSILSDPVKPQEKEIADDVIQDKKKRNFIKESIRNKLNQNISFPMPLWRHKLAGNFDPPIEQIMKGKALFKAVANLIINVIIRPKLAIKNRQLQAKSSEMNKLKETLILYIDETCKWLRPHVKTPISTLVHDKLLNFHSIFERQYFNRSQSIIRLKVRLKSILQSLVNTPPPENVGNFILDLISDGNYFDPDFLYSCEKIRLETNEYFYFFFFFFFPLYYFS